MILAKVTKLQGVANSGREKLVDDLRVDDAYRFRR